MVQHVSKSLLRLCSIIRFIFHELFIYKQIRALAVISGTNQLAGYFVIQWVLIMNRTKYFYFMSIFCQSICYG